MIDANRFYTVGEIVREKIIPNVKNIPMASRLVRGDMLTNKILKAVITKRGINGMQYKIKGENIIRFLAQMDDNKRK